MRIIVTGIGTDVGKTIASAVLVEALEGDYFKPIQCGSSDRKTVESLVSCSKSTFFPEVYDLKHPFSPHHAASLAGITIEREKLVLPKTSRPLVIETAGGIYVPLNSCELLIDVYKSWDASWVVVVSLYVGCINHALLTLEALKEHGCKMRGIVFNGEPEEHMETAILQFSQVPFLGRLRPEKTFTPEIIKAYAEEWK